MINKQKKGISLIVLVITIIVMIILAASVIVSLNNTSIIDKAGQAVDETNESELEHMDALEYLDKFTASVENPWDGSTKESFADGNGTENQPYLISNAAELVYFAKLVNEGNTFEGKYVELTANINLNNIEFTPIGVGNTGGGDENSYITSSKYFDGTFDGKGYIISNININRTDIRGVGLFGVLGENANIKNVEIFSGNIVAKAAVAGIAGYGKGTISNCINRANVTAIDDPEVANSGQLAGGIVGSASNIKISDCKNYGNITGKNDSALRSRGKCIGGIVGQIRAITESYVINSYNYGVVTSYYQQAAGIVAAAHADEGVSLKIEKCENKGKVSAIYPEKEFADNVAIGFVGGIVGWTDTTKVYINECKNSGVINSGRTGAGGIVGHLDGGSEVNNSTNSGTISSASQCAGGIVGEITSSKIQNCINTGAITGEIANGGIVGAIDGEDTVVYNCSNSGRVAANNQQSGGIAGQATGLIDKCTNTGEIYTANGGGGIVGLSGSQKLTIQNCINRGKVDSNNIAGGIASVIQLANSSILDCKNYAEVISNTQQAGGIAGQSIGLVSGCYNEGYIKSNSTGVKGISGGIVGALLGEVKNSYNKGRVETGNYSSGEDDVGGIAGFSVNGKISYSYNKGELIGENRGAILGRASITETTPTVVSNTYYYTNDNTLTGIGTADADEAGKTEKTTTNLDTFEAFKNSSFYAK